MTPTSAYQTTDTESLPGLGSASAELGRRLIERAQLATAMHMHETTRRIADQAHTGGTGRGPIGRSKDAGGRGTALMQG